MRLACFCIGIVVTSISMGASLKSGQIEITHLGDKGLRVEFAKVPLIWATSFQVYAPGWTKSFYSTNSDQPAATWAKDALTLVHRARKGKFDAVETIRATAENRIEITLSGMLAEDENAQLEWAIGYINAFAMYGGSVSAAGSDALRGIFPEPATKRLPAEIVRGAGGVILNTAMGRIEVKVEKGPRELMVIDGRRDPARWWEEEQPTLWLGMLGIPVKPHEKFEYVVSMEFKPAAEREIAPALNIAATTQATADAFVPRSGPVTIIPKPKSIKWKEGERFRIPATLKIGSNEAATRAIASLGEQLARFETKSANAADGADVKFVPARDSTRGPESYELQITPTDIKITANDPAGFFYAVQTLMQMIQVDADGAYIPAAEISDAPSLAFRGVHLFTGCDSVPFFRELATNVLGRFKFNHVVLESEYTQWDSAMGIWTKASVPREQLAEYVKIARENFLEPIPLVQSLGHCEWMFRNG